MTTPAMAIACNAPDIAIGGRLWLEQLRLDRTHRGCPQARTTAAWGRGAAPVEARRDDVFGATSGPEATS
jgi:hypothetical protein